MLGIVIAACCQVIHI